MVNKNQVRQIGDKKVLHKVGKQWKVISLALLLAIGGTAVATHAANADTVNGDNSANGIDETNLNNAQRSRINALTRSDAVNPVAQRAKVHLNPGQRARSSATVIHYWNTDAGSAASYHDRADRDAVEVNSNAKIVNSYVSNIQREYPRQTHALATNYERLENKTKHENSLAQSYKSVYLNKNNAKIGESLAYQAHQYPKTFVASVAAKVTANTSNAKSLSVEAGQLSTAASYADEISGLASNPESKAMFENKLAGDQARYDEASDVAGYYKQANDNTINGFNNAARALGSATTAINTLNNRENLAKYDQNQDNNILNSIANNQLGHIALESAASEVQSIANHHFTNDDSAGTLYNFINSNGDTVPLADGNVFQLIRDTNASLNYTSDSSNDADSLGSAKSAFAALSGNNSSFYSQMNSADAALSSASEVYANDNQMVSNPKLEEIFGVNKADELNSLDNDLTKAENSANDAKEGLNNAETDADGADTALTNDFKADMMDYISTLGSNPVNKTDLRNAIMSGNKFNNLGSIRTNPHFGELAEAIASSPHQYINGIGSNPTYNTAKGNNVFNLWMLSFNPNHNSQLSTDLSTYQTDEANLENADNKINNIKNQQSTIEAQGARKGLMASNSAEAQDIIGGWISDSNITAGTSAINSLAASAKSAASNAVSGSKSYLSDSSATFVEAFSLANSYSTAASSDSVQASNAKNSLENFYVSAANDPDFNEALANYKTAKSNYTVDSDYAQAYGINVWNRAPKYIRIINRCQLHTNVTFGSKSDRISKKLRRGTKLAVIAIGLDNHGTLRYLVRDHQGHEGYVTGMRNYVRPLYLKAQNNTSVIALTKLHVYRDPKFRKRTHKVIKAGRVINGVDIVRESRWNDGFTRIELSNGEFITANTAYVKPVDTSDNVYYYGRKHAGSKFLGYGFSNVRRHSNRGRARYSLDEQPDSENINWLD